MRFLLCLITFFASNPCCAQSPGTCKTYLAVQPLDAEVLRLLSTPVISSLPSEFAISSIHQLEEWDLPSKVAAWKERPSAAEMSQRWTELDKKFNPKGAGVPRPYGLKPIAGKDWEQLETWFAREAPKRISGACVGAANASYVIAVGMIADWSSGGASGSFNGQSDYARSPSATRQDSSVGANAATYSPTAHENSPNDLPEAARNSLSHTCAFLFRANPPGGARQSAPDDYYCKAEGGMEKSAVATMLKYLAKTGL